MVTLKRTAQAEEDLIEIWLYIAQENPDAADRMLDQFENKFSLLAQQPQLEPARPDIAPDLRYFPVGSYLVLYRETPGVVEIVRVVHGARRWVDLL
jgi:toxin ParE1/3/4